MNPSGGELLTSIGGVPLTVVKDQTGPATVPQQLVATTRQK